MIAVLQNKTHSLKYKCSLGLQITLFHLLSVKWLQNFHLDNITDQHINSPVRLCQSAVHIFNRTRETRGLLITFSAWSQMSGSPRNFSGLVDRLSLKVKPNTSYTVRRKSRQPLISSSIWGQKPNATEFASSIWTWLQV